MRDAPHDAAIYRDRVRSRFSWPASLFYALVIGLAVAAEIEIWIDPAQTPRAVTVPVALLWTLPLLLARRFPLEASATVFLALAGESVLVAGEQVTHAWVNAVAIIVAFGVAGTHASLRGALAGAAIGYASVAAIIGNEFPDPADALPISILGAGTWTLGRLFSERARQAADLEERASRLERAHETAVEEGRTRIARDLHDIIAHSVSVMIVQAGAARLLLETDPGAARDPLLSVERTGRQTLADVRRLLGILRERDEPMTLEPQPTVADVPALVEEIRAAGVAAELEIEGEPQPLPPSVDLTAYRFVQEALTNAVEHAPGSPATVQIRYSPHALELEVANDAVVQESGGEGHGLVGVRERVTLYGGTFFAGRDGDGYVVRATLPLNGPDRG